uniref:NACHT domain-containing protein n=1 Tax=Anolis carolinensis TaxID=28377 RepID=A0A803ST50_ANOCA
MSPDYREKYREHVRKKYCSPEDGNPCLMVQIPPNEKYTKMVVASGKEKEHEILTRPWRHTQLLFEQMPATTIDVLFDTENDAPQTVVLFGVAGVGKTLMARKIMQDWATRSQSPERFDSVFYLSCRQMNLIVGEVNLAELILNNHSEPRLGEAINKLLINPGKCLFIIDGFEELNCSIKQEGDNLSISPYEKKPVELILSSLFCKTLFPESCLMITTRPNTLESLEDCLPSPRYVRHLGFSEEGKKEYFCKFFGEEELAAQALSYIKRNEALLAISFVPGVCWIICTMMKEQLDRAEKDLVPVSDTLTGVYALYLSHLFKSFCTGSEQLDLMKTLCSLAADGLWEKKPFLKEEDIRKELALHGTLFRKDPDCEGSYSFFHPSIQEFLAALFYVSEDLSRGTETTKENMNIFLDACHEVRGDLTLTVQFVFGLLNKEIMKYLKEQFEWNISPKIKTDLIEWFQLDTQIEFIRPNYGQLERFYSLYEVKEEEEFVKHALNHLTELTLQDLTFTQMDQVVLCYCINNCLNLETLSLYRCLFLLEECETEVLQRLPNYPDQPLQKTEKPSAIDLLCQTLKDPDGKIKKVELDGCQFTDTFWEDLSVVLSTSLVLVELDLQMTNLKDSGVRLLREGLIHPNCKLNKLGLWGCDLTHACGDDLFTILSHSHTLMELKLGCNSSLGIQGVQLLCEGFKHPNCKLQSLGLDECGLNAAGCQHFIPVLSISQTLRKLTLESNKLGDVGVKLLCEGLKHPQCQLETLSLATCELSPACCGDLSSVLSISQTLRELELEYNKLEDTGLRLLCEGLKQPQCKLEKLGLAGCGITAASCGDLACALAVKWTLKHLDIEYNKLGDSGVKMLCEGLKHPHCRMETLNLFTCDLTAACTKDLASILCCNQTLAQLFLGGNMLGDSGLKQLCEGLKHSQCKIKKLW